MLRDEVVQRRRWLTDAEFLDLLGATNLIPGPNSTEMFIHIGYLRAGWRGLIVGGVCFILPAALIVLGLAWAYVQLWHNPGGHLAALRRRPVIIAVVLQALWGLARAPSRAGCWARSAWRRWRSTCWASTRSRCCWAAARW